MCGLFEGGKNVSKHVGVVEDRTIGSVHNLRIKFGFTRVIQ